MSRTAPLLGMLAMVLTLGSLAGWLVTGRHVFTKYQVPVEVEQDPLLAATGFYDGGGAGGVVRMKEEFHFGLLPASPFGKDAIALVSVAGPACALALAAFLLRRRRNCKEETKS